MRGERARASGYDSVLTSAVSPAESGAVRRRRLLGPRTPAPARARPRRRRPSPPTLPLTEGGTPRPVRRARARRRVVRRVLAPRARSGSRTRSTRRPASRFRVGRDDDRVVAYAITGVAGRYGYLQRIAVHPDTRRTGLGPCARRRRPALDLEARRRPRLREHAVGERRARSRSTGRSASTSSPRACASSGARCERRLAVRTRHPAPARGRSSRSSAVVAGPLVAAARPGRRADRAPTFALAGQSAMGRAQRRLRHAVPRHRRARGYAGGPDRPRPAAVAHRVRRERQRRQPPAVARSSHRSRSTRLPTDASRQPDARVPDGRHQPAAGCIPLEVDLRSASDESLAHFVTHVVVAPVGADGTLTVGVPLQVAWVWPLRADPAPSAGLVPNNPTTLADLEPDGRLGRQATQLAAEHRRAADPRSQPRDARGVEHAVGLKSPTLAAGVGRDPQRRTSGHNQVLTGSVRAPRPAIDPARRPRRGGQPRASPAGSPRSRASSAPTSTPSTALPGPLDQVALRHAPDRQRPSARARRDAAHAREREVHARAPVQGAGGTR